MKLRKCRWRRIELFTALLVACVCAVCTSVTEVDVIDALTTWTEEALVVTTLYNTKVTLHYVTCNDLVWKSSSKFDKRPCSIGVGDVVEKIISPFSSGSFVWPKIIEGNKLQWERQEVCGGGETVATGSDAAVFKGNTAQFKRAVRLEA